MTREEFNAFCDQLTATTNVVQWGNSSVWKVGGKIFAICTTWSDDRSDCISFKCSDLSFSILTEQDGIIPAPYLARAKWVQLETPTALKDEDIRDYVREAHRIISGKLTKKQQKELGLLSA
ncbi:MmcQ/YjbR family DNA-binding protein [Sneathiella sp. P13V-1]|uniref:MmcQ/YjbR family DNA-binding protein n=1 Tax=Sneathiella sp. P13V-1 TaxID=2697366 RepID=UPI00187BA626|nr:MmcQ/YjbR family DNA-binding protein [Sneathiella sp. P13V-1]MBE7637694.1 MmcQ/YjbR family DNA-binding protein [Sneathiella sp. P13V-1]